MNFCTVLIATLKNLAKEQVTEYLKHRCLVIELGPG